MMKDKQEQFEYWLADLDDALERFFNSVPVEMREHLDYSIESLDMIEKLIIEKYANSNQMLEPKETLILDGISRYIGETIRKNVGGKWQIKLDDPKYVYYGLPQLADFSDVSTPECPMSLATTTAERQKGNYLSTVLRNMAKRYKKGN